MKLSILTTDISNKLSCKFDMFILKVAQGIQEYLSVAFLYVLSISNSLQDIRQNHWTVKYRSL